MLHQIIFVTLTQLNLYSRATTTPLAFERVKSISGLSAHSVVKGLKHTSRDDSNKNKNGNEKKMSLIYFKC